MRSPTFVELCAGLGGTRAGLGAAGWKCVFALDNDHSVVAAHRVAFGDCHHGDVRELSVDAIPPHDLLVAGFPCQPFSSSGLRTGFSHEKGNVLQAIARICTSHQPKAILLENVRGLLSNAYGHTFASALRALTDLGYAVTWGVLDAVWFGATQTRPRVFILGTRSTHCGTVGESPDTAGELVCEVMNQCLAPSGQPRPIDLELVISERRPRVGLKRPVPQTPFGVHGVAVGERCWTWDRATPLIKESGLALGDIVCPKFVSRDMVRSVRYWGHSGITMPYFKKEALAHCLGTNIGAGPTFGVEKALVAKAAAKDALLEYANWTREERNHLIFRIVPTRAALLFGPLVEPLQKAMKAQLTGVTKHYEMLGNLVTPEIARRLGVGLRKHLLRKGSEG